MRILLVEDDPRIVRRVKAVLEDAGYAVDLASDGDGLVSKATHRTTTSPFWIWACPSSTDLQC